MLSRPQNHRRNATEGVCKISKSRTLTAHCFVQGEAHLPLTHPTCHPLLILHTLCILLPTAPYMPWEASSAILHKQRRRADRTRKGRLQRDKSSSEQSVSEQASDQKRTNRGRIQGTKSRSDQSTQVQASDQTQIQDEQSTTWQVQRTLQKIGNMDRQVSDGAACTSLIMY